MTPPKFIERVLDSTTAVLAELDRQALVERISTASITLRAPAGELTEPERQGFVLAVNLAARLYSEIHLDAPAELAKVAEEEIAQINPRCHIERGAGVTSATVNYCCESTEEAEVVVFARGWNVYVDTVPEIEEPANPPAALLAASLGISEAFRVLFAAELGDRGRREPNPFAFHLIGLGEPAPGPAWPAELDLGRFNLAGAGAIGQAAALTIAASGARGTLVAIDHETITLANLQRYVLARDSDVNAAKPKLLKQRLEGGGLKVLAVRSKWNSSCASKRTPTLVALDSAEARIELQAALPGQIYNAWTQPADVGFSRHEAFGTEPCLACMYWPDRQRPSRYEQVAAAFKQHPARCLAYLVSPAIPVGAPLPPPAIAAVAAVGPPPDSGIWAERPILDDIATAAGLEPGELASWGERSLADLYQEGICAGAILDLGVGEAPREALVPLAHQSAFAGVMLATQLIVASDPALRALRPVQIEARYDLLSGGPQLLARPRAPSAGCICSDAVYRDVYLAKFPTQPEEKAA